MCKSSAYSPATEEEPDEVLQEFLNDESVPADAKAVFESGSGFNDFNKDNNAEPQSPHEMRRSRLDATAFSALYDRDMLDKSLVSQHMASQRQELKSALLDLMGKEWVSRAWSSMATKTDINAWIKAKEILGWIDSIRVGKVEDLPSYTELASAFLFNTQNLSSVIADGIYEDMCVNAIVCYHFAALVATVARQDKPIIDKLKDNYDTKCEFYGFMTNFSCNSIFCLCHGAIVILRAIMLVENGLPLDSNCKSGADSVAVEFDHSWGKTPESFYNVALPNNNLENYVLELGRVLNGICKRHDFCLSLEDANAFKIPKSALMGNEYPSCQRFDINVSAQMEAMAASFNEGLESLMMTMEQCENDSGKLDSLVSRFQVESGNAAPDSFKSVSYGQLMRIVALNEQRLSKALAERNMEEAKKYLASNIVIENTFFPMLWKTGDIYKTDQIDKSRINIGYKNQQYTSIVEAGSNGLVSQYITEHRPEIIGDIFKQV